jgi:DNA-binding NtrC family response regulator
MKTIYVLDDILYLHNRYKLCFEQSEFDVRTFKEGKEFIKAFVDFTPDIVLLDYELGEAHNGFDVAQVIRSVTKNIPIIIISGHITHDLISRFEPINISKFLTKQFTNEELISAVKGVLNLEIQKVIPDSINIQSSSKKTILTIDDNSQISLLYSMVLGANYDVISCKSFQDVKRVNTNIDLVIMDYNMPGENFSEILSYVKRRFEDAKRVLVTGHIVDYITDNVDKDFDNYLSKPIGIQTLKNKISETMFV